MNLLTLFNLVNKNQEPTIPTKLFQYYNASWRALDAVIDNIPLMLKEGRLVGYPLMEQWVDGIRISQGPIFLDGELVADFNFNFDYRGYQTYKVQFLNADSYRKIGRYVFGIAEGDIFRKNRPTIPRRILYSEVSNGFYREYNASVEDDKIICWYKNKWVRGSVKGCGEKSIKLYLNGEWVEVDQDVDICWNIANKPRIGSKEGL